jgi:hypothetical protein
MVARRVKTTPFGRRSRHATNILSAAPSRPRDKFPFPKSQKRNVFRTAGAHMGWSREAEYMERNLPWPCPPQVITVLRDTAIPARAFDGRHQIEHDDNARSYEAVFHRRAPCSGFSDGSGSAIEYDPRLFERTNTLPKGTKGDRY